MRIYIGFAYYKQLMLDCRITMSYMCCTSSPAYQASKEIDKFLLKSGVKMMQVVRLLLLGTGEAGKTTVLKQMKLIHEDGFTQEYVRIYDD